MTMEVNIFNVFRQPHGDDECEVVNFISTAMHGKFERSQIEDDLELFLLNHDAQNDTKITEIATVFDSCQVQEVNRWRPKLDELPPLSKVVPSSVEVPKLELKSLPTGLKHAFLGPDDTFPVVISSELKSS
ncbi:hypothetical protein ACFX1S_007857 [Malus domestica]